MMIIIIIIIIMIEVQFTLVLRASTQSNTCKIHVRYMYETCTIHVRYMYDTCTIHVRYVYETCTIHVRYMYQKVYHCFSVLKNTNTINFLFCLCCINQIENKNNLISMGIVVNITIN